MAIASVVALVAFFNGRDDSTTSNADAPGTPASTPAGIAPWLRAGDVVIEYPTTGAPRYRPLVDLPALRQMAGDLTGWPPTRALRSAGQSIELRGVPGRDAIIAYAYRRTTRATQAADPALRQFVEYWLGRGAQG